MKVSNVVFSILLCLIVTISHAENLDSIRLVALEQSLQKEVNARKSLNREVANQNKIIQHQASVIDSLCFAIEQNTKTIKTTAEEIGVKIDETNITLGSKANTADVMEKTLWGSVLIIIVTILGAFIYFILHKRINNSSAVVDALKAKADHLNEEIINQFAQEMAEMQKISSSLEAIAKTPTLTDSNNTSEPDHSLIKTLADRITFMEMTLYRMDSSIRGHTPLTRSIRQMKDNLKANGYEIVDMLGMNYDDGMRVQANFIEDEDLEPGRRIITAIIKPQINYKGTMIQSAQITVSQN